MQQKKTQDFIMLPTVDICFQNLMANSKVRKGFVAAVINVPPDSISETILLPTLMPVESADDKLSILDVRVLLVDGTQLNFEMQVRYFEFWDERAMFYLCKMFTGQMKKGEDYDTLKKCIHVSILDFIRYPHDDRCYRSIHLRDDKTGELYSDKLELQILELKKLPREVQNADDIISWMRFFSGKTRKEFETMANTNEYFDEAYHTLLRLSADDKKRLEYEAREKALRDYHSQMNSAEKRGIAIGEERGEKRAEERTKRIFKLNAQGKSAEEIAELCNLTVQRVHEILE